MTNKEVIEKAIHKAELNGWGNSRNVAAEVHIDELGRLGWLVGGLFMPYEEIIFNHDFAKALWGEKAVILPNIQPLNADKPIDLHGPHWKVYLMQMVVADDPIKYLGEHI